LKKTHSIAVRELIEFIYRSGNLDNRFSTPPLNESAILGTKAHKKIQEEYDENYESEVFLSFLYETEELILSVYGRADGVREKDGTFLVDEIKSTRVPLDDITDVLDKKHLFQCMCYGFMICKKNKLNSIDLRITYYNLDDEEMKYLDYHYTVEALEAFFKSLIQEEAKWLKRRDDWNEKRDKSINDLKFPFGEFRKGQRKFSVAVYHTIKDKKKLFAQAPTGTGKTLATLFPSIKAIGQGMGESIFYLTSKTITRQAVETSLKLMREKGLAFKSIIITSKEKMCINETFKCDPYNCPYANGHFDRVNVAIENTLRETEHMSSELIRKNAAFYQVCPHEFSLDLSMFSDCVICDYNYLFDPRAHLQRYFEDGGDYIFLIDEAHNLPDRARDMYSEVLEVGTVKHLISDSGNANKKIKKAARKLETEMGYYLLGEDERKKWADPKNPKSLKEPLEACLKEIASFLMLPGYNVMKEEMTDYFFELNAFNSALERYDKKYTTIYDTGTDTIKVFCTDPSGHIKEMLGKGRATVFFSATLSPLDYYKKLFAAEEKDYSLTLRSPFEQENLCLMVNAAISTRYRTREASVNRIVENIEILTTHKGNYMIFFPSYKYMDMVFEAFIKKNPGIKAKKQEPAMNEADREAFLEAFEHAPNETFIGFVLMGGIFGEGIDLTGSRLSGAVVVGVGMPQIGFERDLIKAYYQAEIGKGWEYAYIFPGANKVMQAVGRVIRTSTDRGVVLLIDDRFVKRPYTTIFPSDWSHAVSVRNHQEIEKRVKAFWGL
jgi:DNA excision repair protein ERCC-2